MSDPWQFSRKSRSLNHWIENTPFWTYLVAIACVVVTTAHLTASPDGNVAWYQLGNAGIPRGEEIWSGHYLGLLTSIFYHGSIYHIFFNMLWILQLGAILETTLSPWEYFLFFVGAAVVGSGTQLALTGDTGIGASGVVYGMFGLMWAGRGRFPEWGAVATPNNLRLFVGWGVLSFVLTELHVPGWNIANGAHAGGFLFGLSVGWVFYSSRHRLLWAIPLTALIALTVLSLTWMPWSSYWTFWKGGQEIDRKHYTSAIRWYERSMKIHSNPAGWYGIALAWANLGQEAAKRHDLPAMENATREMEKAEAKAGPPDPNP